MYQGRCYPFAFFFMEKRDAVAYDLLFEKLIEMMGPENAQKVTLCMSDYESAVRKMLKIHFPNARIVGCFFHYVKAINKQARRFGLSAPRIQIIDSGTLRSSLVEEGFDIIDDKMDSI